MNTETTITLDCPRLNVPATREQAEEIVKRWPHLRRTTAGGELTDSIAEFVNRAQEQKDCDV